LDVFIDHAHRLLGSAVGLPTIVLLVVVWFCDERPWLRYLSLAALPLVILIGVIGGLRVQWNAPELALVKGCLGPLFFGLVVALAAMTSDEWRERDSIASDPAVSGKLHRLAWLTLGLTYLQLVIGAYLRHVPFYAEPSSFQIAIWFHVLVAVAIVVHVALVAWHVWSNYRGESALAGPAAWMAGLIVMQIALGLSTWVVKYGFPAFLGDWAPAGHVNVAGGFWQTHIVTAHVAVGSLILAQALRLGLWSQRLLPLAAKDAPSSAAAASEPSDHAMRAGLAGVTP